MKATATKRLLAALLAMLTLAPLGTACAEKKNDDTPGQDAVSTEPETEADSETQESFDPNLPDGLYFDGRPFTILDKAVSTYNEWGETSIWLETEDADVVNTAIYRRNQQIEEKYGIEFVEYQSGTVTGDIQKSVTAQDDAYQVVIPAFGDCGSQAAAGNFLNLYELPYNNFERAWWDQSSIRDLTIAGKLYFVSSDISMLNNDATWCTMFSKGLIADNTLPEPYDLVASNEWTMENFYTLYQSASRDLNGDGKMSHDDQFANLTQNENYNAMFLGSGERLIAKDSDDLPVVSLGTSERCVGVLDSLIEIMMDKNFSYNYHTMASSLGHHLQTTKMFEEGRGLFWVTNLQIVIRLRNLDADFGIVPVPKYDAEQEQYANVVWTVGSYVAVPITCQDAEFVSAILEAMAAKSRQLLRPAYYEVALTAKYLRDEESRRMMDIVFDERVFDLGLAYNFGGIADIVQNLVSAKSNNISKSMDSKSKAINKAIEKTVDKFNGIS